MVEMLSRVVLQWCGLLRGGVGETSDRVHVSQIFLGWPLRTLVDVGAALGADLVELDSDLVLEFVELGEVGLESSAHCKIY